MAATQLMAGGPTSFLLVCQSYPPVLGGSEVEAQRICAALRQNGHAVKVLCAGGDPMPPVKEWIDPLGVPVQLFGARWKGVWKDRAYALGVAWTLIRERNNYEFVYFLMQGLHLALGMPVARMLGKPFVMKVGGSSVIPMMAGSFIGRLELRWLRLWAARVMILNEGMAAEAKAEGFEERQLLWMPNPVDVNEFSPCKGVERAQLRQQLGLPEEKVILLYVGRLSPEKGVDVLVESYARIAPSLPDTMLVVVGDGVQRGELETLARQQGLGESQVRFAGRVPSHEVRRWVQASDVFSLISPNEGLPCSLIEAMAAGLSSVVSDIPANTQLIDAGVHGWTVPFGDREATGKALYHLLSDEEARDRMGKESRQRVLKQFATDIVVEQYETLFAEVLSHRGKRS